MAVQRTEQLCHCHPAYVILPCRGLIIGFAEAGECARPFPQVGKALGRTIAPEVLCRADRLMRQCFWTIR